MAHIEKFKAKQVVGIVNHTTRTPTDGHTHSNESIDLEKTKFNYELCPNAGYQRYKQRMSEVHCMKRDNVTVLDSLCVTLPSDVKPEDEREFFQAVYEFGCKDYGEENIIYASVHKDEVTPHIHLGFIPIVDDKRRNGEPVQKVNHSKKIPHKYYDTLHTRLSEFVGERLGYEVSILNGATENGNKTITKLKTEQLQKELDGVKKELQELKTARSDDVFEKTGTIKAIGEKLSGGKKLTAAEVETVKNVAAVVAQMQVEYQRQTEEAEKAKSEAEKALQAVETRQSDLDKREQELKRRSETLSQLAHGLERRKADIDSEVDKKVAECTSEQEMTIQRFQKDIFELVAENNDLKKELGEIERY